MTPTITNDEIREVQRRTGWIATTDQGGSFDVVAFTRAGVIVRGISTGVTARIVQTGRRPRRSQVRARFEFARDTSDLAGTFAFDGTVTGGWAPLAVFGEQARVVA